MPRRERRQGAAGAAATYREASSDDEFAQTHLVYSDSDTSSDQKAKGQRDQASSSDEDSDRDSASASASSGDGAVVTYRIQHILARKSMTASAWRDICEKMETREVTKGSVWKQPDDEYFDSSELPVEKFLIKWAHASFLHVSWETERDLVSMVGVAVKNQIKKFRAREFEGVELFDDLSKGEAFPPSFLVIDRILDVDDPEINMETVDWAQAVIPSAEIACDAAAASVIEDGAESDPFAESEDSDAADDEEGDEEMEQPRGRKGGKRKLSKAPRKARGKKARATKQTKKTQVTTAVNTLLLHGKNTWITVKWEGLPYSEVSFERLQDVVCAGIEYEGPLRLFYRREQKLNGNEAVRRSSRVMELDQTVIGNSSTPPEFKGGVLRDYQWEGVRWMLFNLSQNRNSILADEMGLGKTIQSAALLQMIKSHSATSAGPFLIIAPLSLIVNWQREITTWTDLDSILYYGSQEDRELIRAYEFNFLDNLNAESSRKRISALKRSKKGFKVEVVITTPETCVALDERGSAGPGARSKRELSEINWDLVIVDEAHKLKNYESKLGVTLREEYSYRNVVLLTGTPLQNNTDELWTLLNFIDKSHFADRELFYEKFGELKSSRQLEGLHANIRPYLLRREKDIVEKSVPPKQEVIVEVELTVPQKQYYRAIYEQKTQFLYKSGAKDGPSLSNLAMELRKCCNHPFLIKGAAVELAKHFSEDGPQSVLVKTSGKMTLLDKLLPKLHKDQHRVLIFSQFRIMLDIIEDYLHSTPYQYERVDGSVTGRKRQAAIDRFSANPNIFIMLLSTRAGGVGINLTAADTVIIFDSDWNPQNDVQAQARAHRIGQTRAVTVYRLLTRKSYEMVMFKAASLKLGLDYAVMHNLKQASAQPLLVSEEAATEAPGSSRRRGKDRKTAESTGLEGISAARAENFSALSKKELENLLKHGAYDVFLEEKEGTAEQASKVFVDESIEDILQRSSTFLHRANDANVECTKIVETAPPMGGSSTFAKASFISAGKNEHDVAIDDPDFWTKVVGLGVDNGDEEDGRAGKKRRNRATTGSYVEPSDSLKSIYGSRANAYATDSEGDEDSVEVKTKRLKKEEEDDSDVPAVFTADSVSCLLQAMASSGFGNWASIRKASKLRWSIEDIVRTCELGVAMYLALASIPVTPSKAAAPSSSAIAEAADEPAEVAVETDSSPPDAQAFEGNLLKKVDYALFEANLKRFKLCKLVLHMLAQRAEGDLPSSEAAYDRAFARCAGAARGAFADDTACALRGRDAFEECFASEELPFAALEDGTLDAFLPVMQMLIAQLEDAVFPQDVLLSVVEERDGLKIQKKLHAYKLKLAQAEDLFEGFLVRAAVSAAGEGVVPLLAGLERSISDEPLIVFAKDSSPSPIWTSVCDVALLTAVGALGWPEGKKRLRLIQQHMAQALPAVFSQQPKDAGALDAGVGAGAALPEAVAEEPVLANAELLVAKTLVSRLRALAKLFRYSREDVQTVLKAQGQAKQAQLKSQKKNVTAVLKAVQKLGYPRPSYEALRAQILAGEVVLDGDEDVEARVAALLTWQQLASESGMEGRVGEVQTLVEALLAAQQAAAAADGSGPSEASAGGGVHEGVTPKALQAAFEKCDVLHHIRLLLATYGKASLLELIASNCKVMGPSVPIFRRDMTMPFWWTLELDHELLRLVLQHGMGQWKKLLAEPALTGPPADNMQVPPKVNGVEWVTVLVAKALEKRVASLLRGVPAPHDAGAVAPFTEKGAAPGAQALARSASASSATSGAGLGNWFRAKGTAIAVAPSPTPALESAASPTYTTTEQVREVEAGEPNAVATPAPGAAGDPKADLREEPVVEEMSPSQPPSLVEESPVVEEDAALEVDMVEAVEVVEVVESSPVAVGTLPSPTAPEPAASTAVPPKKSKPAETKSRAKGKDSQAAVPAGAASIPAKSSILSFFQKKS